MKLFFQLFFIAVLLVQCRSNEERRGSSKTAALKAADAPEETLSNNAGPSDAASSQKQLHLVAGIEYPKEGAPKPFDVALYYTAQGKMTGNAMLEGHRLDLSGVIENRQFRVWVTGNAGDEERVRRGYLIGEISEDTVTGTFAISGNGGTPSYRGVLTAK